MGDRPLTAVERFKALFANAVERVCVLEEELEVAKQRIAELEEKLREEQLDGAARA